MQIKHRSRYRIKRHYYRVGARICFGTSCNNFWFFWFEEGPDQLQTEKKTKTAQTANRCDVFKRAAKLNPEFYLQALQDKLLLFKFKTNINNTFN